MVAFRQQKTSLFSPSESEALNLRNMGGEQSQTALTLKNQPPRGSQFAPTMGARGQPAANIASEVNKEVNKKFAQEILAVHNKYRALHRAPPLKLSHKLSLLAQEWADRISKVGTPDARPLSFQYGQNLYYSRWATDAESVCRSWYKEGAKYVYDKEPDPPPVNNVNFSQMIWKSSTEIGVGIASSWANVTYIVVNYKPRGNVKGEYKKNLLPLAPVPKTDEPSKRRGSVEEKPIKPEASKATELKLVNSGAVNLGIFQKKMLQLINEFRGTHAVKALKLVSALNDLAQKHAELMASTRKVEPFKGKVSPPVGTSFYCSKWFTEPKDACQFWYAENKRYKYEEPTIVSLSTVNFVQMVWASTKDVGFGRAEAGGYVYVTAFYRPVGNVLGEFQKNVKPFRVSSNYRTSTANDCTAGTRKSRAMSTVLPAI